MESIQSLLHRHREAVLYLIFGGLTTLINLLAYFLCRLVLPETAWGISFANVTAWLVAVLFAYLTNRKWVFESCANTPAARIREALSFAGARVVTLLLELGMLYFGVFALLLDDRIVKVIASILVIIFNYLLSKLWVFRSPKT